MCGIVGVASPGPMSLQMKEFFQSLLLHDVIRGAHATGVAAIDTFDNSLTVEKKAIPSPLFLELKEQMDNLFLPKHNFNIYIGHNRFATSGDKAKDEYAHPFVSGDIVGVHNGSLRQQSLLEDHKNFAVDSENIFYHMNKNGLDNTLEKLNGAFALVWYSRKDNTLNFIRNDERPLAIAKLTNGCWVWASEMGMLRWLVNRHKSLKFEVVKEDGVDVQQIYQLTVGTHLSFEFEDKSRAMPLPRLARKTLPDFPVISYGGSGYDNWGSYSRSCNTGVTRTTYTRSPELVRQDKVIQTFIPTADTNSYLEVKYIGSVEPISRYTERKTIPIALFEYMDMEGIPHRFHCYCHQNSTASTLTEEDIGKFVYGQIGSVMDVTDYTIKEIICPNTDGGKHQMSLFSLQKERITGRSYFSYWTEPQIEARKAEIKKKESQSQSQVDKNAARNVDKTGTMIVLANEEYPVSRWRDVMEENKNCCANCGKWLTNRSPRTMFLLQHVDEEVARLNNYLSCSKRCHREMVQYVEEIDAAYAIKHGDQNKE